MASMSPEKGLQSAASEAAPVRVSQPLTISGQLQEFINGLETISEVSSGRAGEDLPGQSSGAGGALATSGQTSGVSPRDQAIANLPAPAIMQREIAKHIKVEIKKLRKEARRVARVSQPGGAYHLVQVYSKIHRLNALMKELLETSLEVLKRLYVRIFVDRQPI